MARSYDMTRRARDAAQTTERVAEAAEALLATGPIGDLTLQAVARDAGVTVQTVLRHFGTRDGCIEAVYHRVAARIATQRGHTAPGDVPAAIAELLAHYEAEGRLVLNLLAQEPGDPVAKRAVEEGRAYHRAWVERCFGPLVGTPCGEVTDSLVAATDLYLWKLLRLDLGRSVEATRAVLTRLVRSVLEVSCPPC